MNGCVNTDVLGEGPEYLALDEDTALNSTGRGRGKILREVSDNSPKKMPKVRRIGKYII